MKGQGKSDRRQPFLSMQSGGRPSGKSGDGLHFMLSDQSLEIVPEGVQVETPLHLSDDEDEMISPMPPKYTKMRSRSFEDTTASWQDKLNKSEPFMTVKPSLINSASQSLSGSADGLDAHRESDGSSLHVNRALYRKHRELRLSVLEASKQFDMKRADKRNKDTMATRAGLIMKRGAMPPVELEDAHQRALYEAAANRAGRRKGQSRRTKTVSDVSGLLSQL